MRNNQTNFLLFSLTACLFLFHGFFFGLFAQGSGRPKVLVLAPKSDLDWEVVQKFRWNLAEVLDKSGKFDIVTQDELKKYRKQLKIGRQSYVPDSLIPAMLDSFKANIYTVSTLKQEGGAGTPMSAKVDYIIPKNDLTIEGEEFSVENEDKSLELAEKVAQTIIVQSEKISLRNIARSYFNSAIYNKAIENYRKLLKLDPNDVNVHYMIGTAYLKMDSVDTALAKYEQILSELDPNHIPTREILASTYFSREDYKNAVKHYKILAELKPD